MQKVQNLRKFIILKTTKKKTKRIEQQKSQNLISAAKFANIDAGNPVLNTGRKALMSSILLYQILCYGLLRMEIKCTQTSGISINRKLGYRAKKTRPKNNNIYQLKRIDVVMRTNSDGYNSHIPTFCVKDGWGRKKCERVHKLVSLLLLFFVFCFLLGHCRRHRSPIFISIKVVNTHKNHHPSVPERFVYPASFIEIFGALHAGCL